MGFTFLWFFGVVESRDDPLKAGRVRVRVHQWYTDDLTKVPTDTLPWAQVTLPVTESGVSGVGRSPTGIVEGTTVWGFFLDGENAQKPMVLGTLPGIPMDPPDPSRGFSDPNSVYPKFIDEPDVNRLARNESVANTIVKIKEDERVLDVPIARSEDTWDQPKVPYNARYPYNHVWESESGHVIEVDDTDQAERLHRYHRTGTFEEIDPNGTRVTRVVGDDYVIVDRNGFVSIDGRSVVNVGGDSRVLVQNDAHLEVRGDYTIDVGGDMNVIVRGDLNTCVGGDGRTRIASLLTETHRGSFEVNSRTGIDLGARGGSVRVRGSRTALQSGGGLAPPFNFTGLNEPGIHTPSGLEAFDPQAYATRDDLLTSYLDDTQRSEETERFIDDEVISTTDGAGTIPAPAGVPPVVEPAITFDDEDEDPTDIDPDPDQLFVDLNDRLIPGDNIEIVANNQSNTIIISSTASGGGGPDGRPFNLYDDISSQTTTLADGDRFVIADVSAGGQPNRYVTSVSIRDYIRHSDDELFDIVSDFLSAGDNVNLRVTGANNTVVIEATDTDSGTVTQAQVYEHLENILRAGTNVSITLDDNNDTVTINSSGGRRWNDVDPHPSTGRPPTRQRSPGW